jgi:transposase
MTQKKVCKTLKNSNGTVWISDEFRTEIIKYYCSTGDSLKNIAKIFGISVGCVSNIITKYFKDKV